MLFRLRVIANIASMKTMAKTFRSPKLCAINSVSPNWRVVKKSFPFKWIIWLSEGGETVKNWLSYAKKANKFPTMISKNQKKKTSNKKSEKFPLDLTIGAREKQRWPNNNKKKFKKFIPKKCFVILYFLVVLFSLVIINNSFVKAANEKKQSNEPKNV